MANVGLHAGILMHRGAKMSMPSTLNMTHISEIEAPRKAGDLGTIDLWATKRKKDVPWLSIAGIGSNNIIYANKWLHYTVPAMRDGSTVVVEDLSGDEQAGRGKTPFEILVKGVHLGVGTAFKFDLQMRDEFMVVGYREAGENQQVIEVIRQDSDEPVNKMFLQPGVKISALAGFVSSEFGQEFPDFKVDISGGPKYKIPVGQRELGVTYKVTKEVAQLDFGGRKLQITGETKKAMDDAFEYYFKVPGLNDSGLTTLSDALSSDKASIVEKAKESGNISVVVSTLYDSLALRYLARGEQEYQLWGTGGMPTHQGGIDESLAPVGAWQQLDTGFKKTFNISKFGLHTLTAMYREYVHGRTDYPAPGGEEPIEVQTGMGGFQMVQKMIAEQKNSAAIQVMADTFNQVKGTGPMNLEYSPLWFTAIRVPMMAIFKFIYNPAFDRIEDNEFTNPMLPGGHRLSSYNMIVHPENALDGSGNIKIIRDEDDGGKAWMNVINGRGPGHPLVSNTRLLSGNVMATSGSHLGSGYQVVVTKKMDSLHIVDPTRIMKAVAINPYTKKTF